ncbi:uncharacterized protein LOC143038601 isoform X3 [Oratosquilla oratoria]|uniref:uncharacterized protein LOC143038601 isoform X3 n=1 Tax=Oratosquilla oratoria TaxID=337810 RepID=UPI003F7672E0
MSSKDEKVTLRDDGEGGGGRSSSDGGVEGGGVDVRLDGDIEEPNLDSGVDPSISVDNADVGVEQSRLQMENTKLEDGVETFTDASSGKLDEVDSERVDAVTGERLSNIDDTRLSEVDGERLDSSGGDVGGEAQAITITIMDPGSLDPSALDPGTLSGALVTTVEAQSEDATGFMVNEDGTIVVQGDEGLHAVNDVSIALINSASDNTVTSLNQVPDSERTSSIIKADNSSLSKRRDALRKDFVSVSAAEEEEEDDDEEIGRHCFICNVDLPLENPDDSISVFKTQTTSSSRKVSVILSSLVGQTLTARKAHSDIMCRRCFSLLDRVDTLEVEIKSSKEEIVTKFQNTIAMYGGRARKRKPTAAVRRDFVFPKVEPEDDYEAKELDMDDNFEPTVDDLMQEEADERDDDNLVDVNTAEGDDTEWEPQTKRPRVKKEPVDIADPNAPPKRKRGRPRKGTTSVKSKAFEERRDVSGPLIYVKKDLEAHVPGREDEEEERGEEEEEGEEEVGGLEEAARRRPGRRRTWNGDRWRSMVDTRLEQIRREAHRPEEDKLECSCGERFEKRLDLLRHAIYKERRLFACSRCDLRFSSSLALARHQRLIEVKTEEEELKGICQEEKEKGFKPWEGEGDEKENSCCRLCGCHLGKEVSPEVQTEHLGAVHVWGTQECPVCSLRLDTRPNLLEHIHLRHCRLFSLACYYLEEVGSRKDSPEGGGGGAEDETGGRFRCDVCAVACEAPKDLDKHKLALHPEHFPLPCPACPARFSKPADLRGHVEATHVTEAPETTCSVCRIDCKTRTNLNYHMSAKHRIEVSGLSVEDKTAAAAAGSGKRRGVRRHGFSGTTTTTTTTELRCKVCSRVASTPKALRDHMRVHRRVALPCQYCGATLRTAESLAIHVNQIHTREVKFPCQECDQVFYAACRLTDHVKRNHRDRHTMRHLCHLCGKSYLYPSELRHHLRSHRNERLFKCTECHKAFLKRVDLTYHMRIHTGERPHKCPYCDARFPRPNTLKYHIRGQHANSTDTRGAATATTSTNTVTTHTSAATPSTTPTTTPTVTSAPAAAATASTASAGTILAAFHTAPAPTMITSSSSFITPTPTPTTAAFVRTAGGVPPPVPAGVQTPSTGGAPMAVATATPVTRPRHPLPPPPPQPPPTAPQPVRAAVLPVMQGGVLPSGVTVQSNVVQAEVVRGDVVREGVVQGEVVQGEVVQGEVVQPLRYVQVEDLGTIHQVMETVQLDNMPYQIVHLQILP